MDRLIPLLPQVGRQSQAPLTSQTDDTLYDGQNRPARLTCNRKHLHPSVTGAEPPPPIRARPVHTFSIVARDPATGELGVAVQSHWFSVGPIVPWAESLPLFWRVFKADKNWQTLTPRLSAEGLLPADQKIIDRILNAADCHQ